jgi:uncharacterized ubiquitin-like protein YukD
VSSPVHGAPTHQPLPGQPDQTVHVLVQIIDMKSFMLDLQVPNYLPARDLTQRVARDAGLNAYWPDGTRRLYWLRARGRLLTDNETLGDLGVVNNELVYLLPEPPRGSGVLEQNPDYPETRGYLGKGTLTLVAALFGVMLWAVGWGVALLAHRNLWTIVLPGLAQGLLLVSFARHLWGGRGNAVRIAATAVVLYTLIFVLVFLPSVLAGEPVGQVYAESMPGFITGLVGVLMGWLAWWGPVEPLPVTAPRQVVEEQAASVALVPCGICGGGVAPDVLQECVHRCGQTFHKGCYQARMSVYRGDPRFCGVCNARVG